MSQVIGGAHRDILFYPYFQDDSFSATLRNKHGISRSHAFYLMKFYKLAEE